MQTMGDFMSIISGRGNASNRASRHKIPVDVVNEEKTITIYAEIPGINKENITVDFYNNKLTISAEKVRTYQSVEVSELKFGRYERVITLPLCVTCQETVGVTYENGVLKITIAKCVEEENKFSIRL